MASEVHPSEGPGLSMGQTIVPVPSQDGPDAPEAAEESESLLDRASDLILDHNPFNLYADPKASVDKSWHASATALLYALMVLGVFGLVFIHVNKEHYDFNCIPAGSALQGQNYHIGMCECTKSETVQMSLNTAVAYSGCGSQPLFNVRSCVKENEVCTVNGGFKGILVKAGVSGPFCFAVEYTCLFGTCFPNGKYYGFSAVVSGSCLLDGMSAAQVMPAFTPPVKCCGFTEQTKLSQALNLIGNIGGTFGLITAAVLLLCKGRIMRTADQSKDSRQGTE